MEERGPTAKNILIVDDHALFAEMLAVVLGRALRSPPTEPEKPPNFPMFAYATSIAGALRLVSGDLPLDLAVVDLMLPDGNGTTVVREIKRRSPITPVAVLTASQDLSEALAAGADEAMPKRARLEEIVACLVGLLRVPDQPGTQDA
jgi:DNA-binding NarL/FixJ family response regulator